MIKGIRRKELNSKLNKCSTRFRPFIGATLKQMEIYVKPILNDDTTDVLIQKKLNDKVIAVNNILKRVYKLNGLGFIDNSNICAEKFV